MCQTADYINLQEEFERQFSKNGNKSGIMTKRPASSAKESASGEDSRNYILDNYCKYYDPL